jgi:hypothetical protein
MRFWSFRDRVTANGEVVADPGELRAELREAYAKGRRDERVRHRRSPLLSLVLLAIAAVGAVMLFYAAREGSFSGGGAVVDTKLSHATESVVQPAVNNAAAQTGAAIQDAGERLKDKAAALSGQASNPTPPSN